MRRRLADSASRGRRSVSAALDAGGGAVVAGVGGVRAALRAVVTLAAAVAHRLQRGEAALGGVGGGGRKSPEVGEGEASNAAGPVGRPYQRGGDDQHQAGS